MDVPSDVCATGDVLPPPPSPPEEPPQLVINTKKDKRKELAFYATKYVKGIIVRVHKGPI